jgi:hypothetical protein
MNRISGPRKTANLSTSLRRKIDMYGVAAAATGLGMAALATPAQGEVVFTPAHQEISRDGLTIDLNHDGIPDFGVVYAVLGRADSAGVLVSSLHGNRVFSGTSVNGRQGWVANLPAGYHVGPNSAKFKAGGTFSSVFGPAKFMDDCFIFSGPPSCDGPWYKTQNSYVGFQFSIKGETHYGWARFKTVVQSTGGIHAFLTGYAYETIANKPIVTGQTSGADEGSALESGASRPSATLGMLSAGASALPIWRLSLQ